jgi:nucleotide-binding universal stress UspA family protein
MVHKILVGLDTSENSEKLIKAARNVQKKFDSEIVFYHSIGKKQFTIPFSYYIPETSYVTYNNNDYLKGKKLLETEINSFVGDDVAKIEKRLVTESTAYDYAIKACKDEDIDLIILGQKRKHRIWDHFRESTTQNVLNKAECDVMIVK